MALTGERGGRLSRGPQPSRPRATGRVRGRTGSRATCRSRDRILKQHVRCRSADLAQPSSANALPDRHAARPAASSPCAPLAPLAPPTPDRIPSSAAGPGLSATPTRTLSGVLEQPVRPVRHFHSTRTLATGGQHVTSTTAAAAANAEAAAADRTGMYTFVQNLFGIIPRGAGPRQVSGNARGHAKRERVRTCCMQRSQVGVRARAASTQNRPAKPSAAVVTHVRGLRPARGGRAPRPPKRVRPTPLLAGTRRGGPPGGVSGLDSVEAAKHSDVEISMPEQGRAAASARGAARPR